MFKLITMLKRRPGMSLQEFIDYYEGYHARIGEKYLRGSAVKYIRRFLHPIGLDGGTEGHSDFYDVVMEIWFPDEATFISTMHRLTTDPAIVQEIAEDEEKLFDRSMNRSFTVEEHESDMG